MSESVRWSVVTVQVVLLTVQLALLVFGTVSHRRAKGSGQPFLLTSAVMCVPVTLLMLMVVTS